MEKKNEKTRFDTRITKEQKNLLEEAAAIGGYRSLSEFVISSAQQKAEAIIIEYKKVLVSQKDSEIFFNAITNPEPPNQALADAFKDYESLISE